MSVDVEEVNYIFMVCLYLKLKKTLFGYFWLQFLKMCSQIGYSI